MKSVGKFNPPVTLFNSSEDFFFKFSLALLYAAIIRSLTISCFSFFASSEIKIDFICTPFDFESVDFLEKVNLPAYKIASADLINTPLQSYIAKKNKPIFLSTGGGNFKDIERAYRNISKYNKKISILHCTASYPAALEDMNLNVITELKKKYKSNTIGLSDHENGIDAASVAYMLGARVFEKHFTLDRSWKGTDHSFSMEPDGFRKFVRDIRRVPKMMKEKNKSSLGKEKVLYKLGKSIVANKSIKAGKKLKIEFDTSKPDIDVNIFLDCSKAKSLGWSPKYSFENGVELTFKWMKDNTNKLS